MLVIWYLQKTFIYGYTPKSSLDFFKIKIMNLKNYFNIC